MMKKKEIWATTFLMITLIALPSLARGQDMTGREIMTLVDEQPDGDDRKSVMKMTLVNKRGRQRVREMESFSRDYGKDKKSVIVFRKPADVKGTAFLSWEYDDPAREDDKWLYMPAMKKVRRISGSSKNEYFMGSDFTYDDMGDRNVDEDTHTLLSNETLRGQDCWKIESIPVNPDDMYTRKVLYVSKKGYLVIQAEYYDKNVLIKVYKVLDYREQDGFWVVFHSEMDNVSRSHKTILEMDSIQFNTGLGDDLFKVSTIQRGRIR